MGILPLSILVVFFSIVIPAYWYRIADNDLFARIAVGSLIAEGGTVPLSDPFSFAPTKSVWIDHEWLAGVVFNSLYTLAGDFGLFVLNLFLAFITISCLVLAQRAVGGNSKLNHALLFPACFSFSFIWNSTIRAWAFTFCFFALLLLIVNLTRKRQSISLLYVAPLIMVLWVNLHGGFVVGLGFLGICSLALFAQRNQHSWQFILVTCLSVAVVFINPYGLQYADFILQAVFKARPAISEWSSVRLTSQYGILFIIILLTLTCFISRASRQKLPLEAMLFLVVSMAFALRHGRHLPFFLFSACVYLPMALVELEPLLGRWLRERVRNFYKVLYPISLFSGFGGIALSVVIISNWRNFSLDYSQYPVQAMAWLKQSGLNGNILNHFNQGSYILLYGYPNFKVAIDGRYEEVYSEDTFEMAFEALNPASPNFRRSFLGLNPDLAVLCKATTPFEIVAEFPGQWQRIYIEDSGHCAVFKKLTFS